MATLFDDMEDLKRRFKALEARVDEALAEIRKPTLGAALLAEDAQYAKFGPYAHKRAPDVPPLPDHPRFRNLAYRHGIGVPVAQFDLDGRGTWVDIVNLTGGHLENCIAVALRICDVCDNSKWAKLEQRLKK